ncbi:MAG: hypothetical protein A3F72_07170 [Bacteroidetes bacterium RIFCSPLOWO2_12_FULL_35_15]|nr:MAG: hypothetical protein A3F72_07170 [Bacteroidetes bacterium RIFCSPLOWO2_12_FULL_35_15]
MKKQNIFILSLTAILSSAIIFTSSCGGAGEGAKTDSVATAPVADPKGIGEFTHVEISATIDEGMVTKGKGIYELKCSACHKLTDAKLVGPGWAGISKRRTPEWIMNMTTNTEVMLNQDPEAQKLLELCLVRMPNQGLNGDDARSIVEFMRKNDGQ